MRLIDADELKKCYEGETSNKASYFSIRKMIDCMPTAYDIDKVVEELEEMSGVQYDCEKGGCQFNDCIYTPRAIEIVKQGLKSQDSME